MIESTVSMAQLNSVMGQLKAQVSAQRYLILLGPDEIGNFVVGASHGLEADKVFSSESISLTVLRSVAERKRAFVCETPEGLTAFNCNTTLLSGIQSLLCVPVFGKARQVVGLVYLDDLINRAAFCLTEQLKVENLAKALTVGAPHRTQRESRAVATPRAAPRSPAGKPIKLRAKDKISLFLQLATFVNSGISLMRGLEAIAQPTQGAPAGPLNQLARKLQESLLVGNSLSESLAQAGHFKPFLIGLVRSAERSGRLAQVLQVLAADLEKSRDRETHLTGSLVYPLFLLGLCLLVVGAVPSLILKAQLEFYAQQGMELPALSLLLLQLGKCVATPWVWAISAAVLLSLERFSSDGRKKVAKQTLQKLVHRLSGLGHLQRMQWELRVLTSLQLLLNSGIMILEAIPLAIESSDSVLWKEQQSPILSQMREGKGLSRTLPETGLISFTTTALLTTGEESGSLVKALGQACRLLEVEFDCTLETALSLLEPAIMVIMGIAVGLITLASLLPSIQYIQNL